MRAEETVAFDVCSDDGEIRHGVIVLLTKGLEDKPWLAYSMATWDISFHETSQKAAAWIESVDRAGLDEDDGPLAPMPVDRDHPV